MYQTEIPVSRSRVTQIPPAYHLPPGPDVPVVDIPAVLEVLWHRRSWIAWTVAAAMALVTGLLLLRTETYTASTRILIDPRGLQVLDKELIPNSSSGEGGKAMVESQVRVITSSQVLQRVVEREGLATDIEFGARPPSLLSVPFSMLRTAFGSVGAAEDPEAKALRNLRRAVSADRPKDSYVIDLFVTTQDSDKSARIANAIAQAYIEAEQAVRTAAAERILGSLAERAEELREQVRVAEQKVEAYRRTHDILTVGGSAGTDPALLTQVQVSQMNQQVSLAKARVSQARAKVEQIELLRSEGGGLGSYSDAVQSETITQLRTRYSAAREQVASLATTLGPRHPRLAAAEAQVLDIEHTIGEELARIARSARGDLQRAVDDEAELVRKLEKVKRAAVDSSEAEVELRELERTANASRVVYESFLVRAREIREQKGLDTTSERILSAAVPPVDRDGPRTLFLLGFAGALAIGLGAVLALVGEQFDGTVHNPGQIARLTGIGVLAHIRDLDNPAPGITAGADAPAQDAARRLLYSEHIPAVVYHRGQSESASAFRRLEEMLHATSMTTPRRVILVSSPGSEDGKSTVALNLALAAYDRGERVLLVDADVAQRPFMTAIGARVDPRREQYPVLTDDGRCVCLAPIEAVCTPVSGKIGAHAECYEFLRSAGDFDSVIMDASALGSASDLHRLEDIASHVVLVVRANTTTTEGLGHAVHSLAPIRHKVRGAVLLDV